MPSAQGTLGASGDGTGDRAATGTRSWCRQINLPSRGRPRHNDPAPADLESPVLSLLYCAGPGGRGVAADEREGPGGAAQVAGRAGPAGVSGPGRLRCLGLDPFQAGAGPQVPPPQTAAFTTRL